MGKGPSLGQVGKAIVLGTAQTVWDYHIPILHFLSGRVASSIKPKLKLHSGTSRYDRFLTVRTWKKYVRPLWKRSVHVQDEHLHQLPKITKRTTVRYVVHEHHAKKAGLHYDLRFMVNGRGISFVIPKHHMPAQGEQLRAIHQPDHVEEFFDFEGIIPDGQYGAGFVKIAAAGQMDVLECGPDKVVFDIWDGPKEFQGRFVMFSTTQDWIIQPFAPVFEQVKKHSFKTWNKGKFEDNLRKVQEEQRLAELKVDGSHEIVRVDKHGRVFLLSHRVSAKDGRVIDHTVKLPGLHDDLQKAIDQLGLRNCVLHGEVYHERGAGVLSGILNSLPKNAREFQEKHGDVRIALFDAGCIENRAQEDIPYTERFSLLKKIAQAGGDHVHTVDQSEPGEDIPRFARRVQSNPRIPNDGIIAKDPQAGYKQEVIPRVKDVVDADCVIVKVNEGTNGLRNHVGSLTVRDEHGKLVRVGSFPGKPQAYRALLWEIRNELVGQTVQVAFHKRDAGLDRTGPRFMRFHPGKSSAPLFERTKGMDEENWHDLAYKMKTSQGWRTQ